MEGAPSRGGVLDSARGLLSTALTLLHTRFELFATELEEEKYRLLALILWGAVAVLGLGIGLVFVAVFFTVLFWDTNRLLVLGIFSTLFCATGVAAVLMVRHFINGRAPLFAASLAELAKDRAVLRQTQP